MDKCRWEDGEFKACFDNHRLGIVPHISKMQYRYINPSADEEYYHAFNDNPKYCSYCGADIRKPEPEVIIKETNIKIITSKQKSDAFVVVEVMNGDSLLSKERVGEGNDFCAPMTRRVVSEVIFSATLSVLEEENA